MRKKIIKVKKKPYSQGLKFCSSLPSEGLSLWNAPIFHILSHPLLSLYVPFPFLLHLLSLRGMRNCLGRQWVSCPTICSRTGRPPGGVAGLAHGSGKWGSRTKGPLTVEFLKRRQHFCRLSPVPHKASAVVLLCFSQALCKSLERKPKPSEVQRIPEDFSFLCLRVWVGRGNSLPIGGQKHAQTHGFVRRQFVTYHLMQKCEETVTRKTQILSNRFSLVICCVTQSNSHVRHLLLSSHPRSCSLVQFNTQRHPTPLVSQRSEFPTLKSWG